MISHSVTTVVPDPRRAPPKPRRPRVLVVLHGDGWVEVFGDGTDVHIAQALDAELPEELLAEAYLDNTIPWRFRELHLPGQLLAAGQCERRTPEQEAARRVALGLIRECRNLAMEAR